MPTVVKITGRTSVVEKITHAILVKEQIRVFPVEYHECVLTGEDMIKMTGALEQAGFIRIDDFLINPERITVFEGQGALVRTYLEGADKILYLRSELVDLLFAGPREETAKPKPAPRKPKAPPLPDPNSEKKVGS
jgi:hypothetical protein